MKYLGDPAGWMKSARIKTPGKGRTNPNLWNPLVLAVNYLKREDITDEQKERDVEDLHRRFKTRPELSAWRGEWETGQGAYLD